MNKLIYTALVIHLALLLVISIAGSNGDEEMQLLAIIISIPISVNFIGFCLLRFTNKTKLGAKLFMYSSYAFVPIGMIGVSGARTILDDITKKNISNESL